MAARRRSADQHHDNAGKPYPAIGDRFSVIESPMGDLLAVGTEQGLSGLYFLGHRNTPAIEREWQEDDGAFACVRDQLREYFAGARSEFSVELDLHGTPFQRSVWSGLLEIPFGETVSYGALAERIGKPRASRAVGLANGRNPVSIIVPCHRVIGSNGSLTGYGWGTERKEWLLEHESGHGTSIGGKQ